MTLATPWMLWAAALGAVVTVVWHLFSVRTPPVLVLPTARFVPEGDAPALVRQRTLSDRTLLLLRIMALLLMGSSMAAIQCAPSTRRVLHLLVVDRDTDGDSVRLRRTELLTVPTRDVLVVEAPLADDPGSAFVAAEAAVAARLRKDPSIGAVALHVALPTTVRNAGGWSVWRAQWPADVSLSVVTPKGSDASKDSVIVRWAGSSALAPWRRRRTVDTVGAVVARGQALIAPWEQRWTLDSTVLRTGSARVLAWWSDGEPAGIERHTATGCERLMGFTIPDGSDLLLSPGAAGLRAALEAPCHGGRLNTRLLLGDSLRAASRREGTDSAVRRVAEVPTSWFGREAPRGSEPVWLSPLLLAVSLGVLLIEGRLRRRDAA